jgi:ferredoxin-thioredoxin reductase catalytic subunit
MNLVSFADVQETTNYGAIIQWCRDSNQERHDRTVLCPCAYS